MKFDEVLLIAKPQYSVKTFKMKKVKKITSLPEAFGAPLDKFESPTSLLEAQRLIHPVP